LVFIATRDGGATLWSSIITGPAATGTDRVAQAAAILVPRPDVVVNLQGDEPLIEPEAIETLLAALAAGGAEMATLARPLEPGEMERAQVVKVVTDLRGDALYFSHLPIPFDRDNRGGITYWKHIGLYAYRRPVLDTFHSLPPSSLERAEQLEQLRLLEAGIPIHVLETHEPIIGVDTEEDLRAAEAQLASRPR